MTNHTHDLTNPSAMCDEHLVEHAGPMIAELVRRDLLIVAVPTPQGAICLGASDYESVAQNGPAVQILVKTRFGEPEKRNDDE